MHNIETIVQPQGWKVHISATPSIAKAVLEAVLPIFAKQSVTFKFLSDMQVVRWSVNKNWPRSSCGKFLTIYPRTDDELKEVIEQCYVATQDLVGPYILTDRPYKNSKVIFYRYGTNTLEHSVGTFGERLYAFRAPDGQTIPDRRFPYYFQPTWVQDPFGSPAADVQPAYEVLLNKRYRILKALKHSGDGGVYSGIDNLTGDEVIVHEARPMGASENPGNAMQALIRIATHLKKLEGTGIAPKFLALFSQGHHMFLVQERLYADSLWGHASNTVFQNNSSPLILFERIRRSIRSLFDSLSILHSYNIYHRDLTKSNVLISRDTYKVHFIDWEFAFDASSEFSHVFGFTEGYTSPGQLNNDPPSSADDIYSAGALVLDMLIVMATGFGLNREGILNALTMSLADLGLPPGFADLVRGMTAMPSEARLTLEEARAILDGLPEPIDLHNAPDPLFRLTSGMPAGNVPDIILSFDSDIQNAVAGVVTFINNHADLGRRDRLWPASAEVFATNSLSIQHGAAGIAYALLRIAGKIPEPAVKWIRERLSDTIMPFGFYRGSGGVAMFLCEAGLYQEAEDLLNDPPDQTSLYSGSGLYYGAAGWGYANLVCAIHLGKQKYLDRAISCAEVLIARVETDEAGAYWTSHNQIPLGLGEGPSGVALFLTYLYSVVQRERYIELAARAIDYDVAHMYWIGNLGVLWHKHGAPDNAAKSPHVAHGSCGVASAALRLYAMSGHERFRIFAERMFESLATRYTNKLWQDYGRAGFCEYFVDCYHYLGSNESLRRARYIAESILPHAVIRDGGVAFAGSDLSRYSCDFGMGSAGIALALQRVISPTLNRPFFYDDLLGRQRCHDLKSSI
jgi:serine/threonine protein kinase